MKEAISRVAVYACLVVWSAAVSDCAIGGETDADAGAEAGSDLRSDAGMDADGSANSDASTNSDAGPDPRPQIGAECYEGPENYPAVPSGLTLNTEQAASAGYTETAQVTTDGIFAVHWAGITQEQANWVLRRLAEVRCLSLAYGMQDPPTVAKNWYYNVFVHTGVDGLGNGQGTDGKTNMPFLTMPVGPSNSPQNVDHEGFHIFQYRSTSPGFAYAGDSQWFTEAAASWFGSTRTPDGGGTFVAAGVIVYNPHLALWHSFGNEAPGDPGSAVWTYGVHQYAMDAWLFYLTERAGASRAIIPAGFYAGTDQLPQEYCYRRVGEDKIRAHFADWAVHSRADFDYLTRGQVEAARNEVNRFIANGDKVDPYVAELPSRGTGGAWQSPPAALKPRGWSFNTVRLAKPVPGSYRLAIQGDANGSEGAASHFEGRVVVMYGEAKGEFAKLSMSSKLNGAATVTVKADATELYLVVVAVPEHFKGNQNYGYKYRIDAP